MCAMGDEGVDVHDWGGRRQAFCPLSREFVQVRDDCQACIFWEDDGCVAYLARSLGTRLGHRVLERRLARGKRLPRRRGRGLRTSPAPETWPTGDAAQEQGLTPIVDGEDDQMGDGGDEIVMLPTAPEPWEAEVSSIADPAGIESVFDRLMPEPGEASPDGLTRIDPETGFVQGTAPTAGPALPSPLDPLLPQPPGAGEPEPPDGWPPGFPGPGGLPEAP